MENMEKKCKIITAVLFTVIRKELETKKNQIFASIF